MDYKSRVVIDVEIFFAICQVYCQLDRNLLFPLCVFVVSVVVCVCGFGGCLCFLVSVEPDDVLQGRVMIQGSPISDHPLRVAYDLPISQVSYHVVHGVHQEVSVPMSYSKKSTANRTALKLYDTIRNTH